jgi:hypothetical protein
MTRKQVAAVEALIKAIESVQDWQETYVGECIDAVEESMSGEDATWEETCLRFATSYLKQASEHQEALSIVAQSLKMAKINMDWFLQCQKGEPSTVKPEQAP